MYISRLNKESDKSNLPLKERLRQYMAEHNLADTTAADILSVNRKTLTNILEGGEIKMSYAIRIMNLLNIKDEDLIRSYMDELNDEEIENIEKAKLSSFILENFDLLGLREAGIIKRKNEDYEIIGKTICSFFGFDSIYEYNSSLYNKVLYSKSKMSVAENREFKMQNFWIKCAIDSFARINNPNDYNEHLLIEFVKRIKTFTKDVNFGFAKVINVLYQLGITVLVQPYINHTKAFGISMIVNDKPCIVITDLGKKYHKLWLTLLHELYHILNDYEYISKANYHVSNPEFQDLFVSEEDADLFSRSIILSEKSLKIASSFIKVPYKVSELAKLSDIHTTMVYGIYLESLNKDMQSREYPKYATRLLKSEVAIKNIIFDPVAQKGIVKAVERMKQQLNILTA